MFFIFLESKFIQNIFRHLGNNRPRVQSANDLTDNLDKLA